MLIEIAGIPGSGKTTLQKRLAQELRRRDAAVVTVSEIANTRSGADNTTPRYVKNHPHRELLYHFTHFTTQNAEFFKKAQQTFGGKTTKKFLFFLVCGHFQMARALKKHNEMVLIDEAILTHCVSIYPKREQQSELADLLSCAPEVDVLIHLETPAHVAFERAIARRGGTDIVRAGIVNKFGDESAFAERLDSFKVGIKSYKEHFTTVLNVDSTKSLDVTVDKLACELIAIQAKGSRI